jgi:hypothetical protein
LYSSRELQQIKEIKRKIKRSCFFTPETNLTHSKICLNVTHRFKLALYKMRSLRNTHILIFCLTYLQFTKTKCREYFLRIIGSNYNRSNEYRIMDIFFCSRELHLKRLLQILRNKLILLNLKICKFGARLV